MKRIISVLLSFAIMLTALCVPAFAEGGTGGSGNIDGGGAWEMQRDMAVGIPAMKASGLPLSEQVIMRL